MVLYTNIAKKGKINLFLRVRSFKKLTEKEGIFFVEKEAMLAITK